VTAHDLLEILDDAHTSNNCSTMKCFPSWKMHSIVRGRMTVGDIMVPRRQMVTLKASDSLEAHAGNAIIESEHSRFPVLG
jgi:Mg2+/Co2+ transporter CorC